MNCFIQAQQEINGAAGVPQPWYSIHSPPNDREAHVSQTDVEENAPALLNRRASDILPAAPHTFVLSHFPTLLLLSRPVVLRKERDVFEMANLGVG